MDNFNRLGAFRFWMICRQPFRYCPFDQRRIPTMRHQAWGTAANPHGLMDLESHLYVA